MDDLDRVIQRMLGEPTPAHLQAVAVRLQAEVDTLLARLAGRRMLVGKGRSATGRPPGLGVRWTGRQLAISRGLFHAIGSPRHVKFIFRDGWTEIHPSLDTGDYSVVSRRTASPHVTCIRVAGIAGWEIGWRPAEIAGGAIRFRAAATTD